MEYPEHARAIPNAAKDTRGLRRKPRTQMKRTSVRKGRESKPSKRKRERKGEIESERERESESDSDSEGE